MMGMPDLIAKECLMREAVAPESHVTVKKVLNEGGRLIAILLT